MSRPALRIVSDDELPPYKRRVTWKAGPSKLVLSREPIAPRSITLALSVECVWRGRRAWPWALAALGALALLGALGAR